MNIISPKNSTGAVSLKQLIPDHESLKLLILHTPFPLEITTLPKCLNLVKLDLSKNSIKAFPFLGSLKFLRIAFVHENLLGINEFISIFQRDGTPSILSENIVWVTYWGNKNVFLARHYAVHKTKAIAFDKNIIVQEERKTDLAQRLPVFCPESDITDIYSKKNYLNQYTTQEEYMQDFWITLKMLRRRYEVVNPIIKIQKVFRGWIFREKLRREFQKEKENYMILLDCFKEWKKIRRKEEKLKRLLKGRRKTYLLYSSSKINQEYILTRIKELAQIARNNVLRRRLQLEHQIRFYSILRGNLQMLRDLYQQLQIDRSSAAYIFKDDINHFVEHVVPFVKTFCRQDMSISLNEHYHLHFLHDSSSKKQGQFINMVKTNRFSIVSSQKPLERMLQLIRFKRPSVVDNSMKAIFGRVHISTEKKEKVVEQEKHLEQIKKQERDQLIKIDGTPFLLKTIVRGVYFYNSNRLSIPAPSKHQRINLFSQRSLQRISSAVAIQRAWKGFIFRKKHKNQLKQVLRYQKAATIIQRWFRRLPCTRRKYFLLEVESRLHLWDEAYFIVDFQEYYLKVREGKDQKQKYIMLEQHVQVYKNKVSGEIVVTWDDSARHNEINNMLKLGKMLFPAYFLAKIGLSPKQMPQKTSYSPDILQRCHISHLFHYKTSTSILRPQGIPYLHIECQSKVQARFRMLSLYLMCYDFKSRSSLDFYSKQDFTPLEISRKALLGTRQISIICNQNMSLIKYIQENCTNIEHLSIYIIENRIFLQADINRQPFKVQERFIIYLINHQEKAERATFPQSTLSKKQNKNELTSLKLSNPSISPPPIKAFPQHTHLVRSINTETPIFPLERKILVKKRSIKQFKAKVKRKPEQQPSFIIDNKSSDRVTQNHSKLDSSHKITTRHPSEPSPKHTSEISQSRPLMPARGRLQASTRRKQQDFTRRFINMGNFMQNQLANDYRKRIKTEMEQLAHISAEGVRASAQRSSSHKEENMGRKYMKAREMEQAHRSMVEHGRNAGLERSLLLRSNVEALRVKLKEDGKGSLRKPRVSFAEQNFPIVHKKARNFSLI